MVSLLLQIDCSRTRDLNQFSLNHSECMPGILCSNKWWYNLSLERWNFKWTRNPYEFTWIFHLTFQLSRPRVKKIYHLIYLDVKICNQVDQIITIDSNLRAKRYRTGVRKLQIVFEIFQQLFSLLWNWGQCIDDQGSTYLRQPPTRLLLCKSIAMTGSVSFSLHACRKLLTTFPIPILSCREVIAKLVVRSRPHSFLERVNITKGCSNLTFPTFELHHLFPCVKCPVHSFCWPMSGQFLRLIPPST